MLLSKLFSSSEKGKKKLDDYVFTFEPKALKKGKESIQEMSLIKAQYNDFIVTKTGYLVALIKASGVNLDLMNETEQEEVFDDFNAFLMSTLGEGSDDEHQFLDMTIPVNFNEYVLYWKKRYLEVKENEPENKAKILLVASYVDHYSKMQSTNEMTTKDHIIVLRQKIRKNNLASLEKSHLQLEEKVNSFIKNLEDSLSSYDMEARKLTSNEVIGILRHLINFSNH